MPKMYKQNTKHDAHDGLNMRTSTVM